MIREFTRGAKTPHELFVFFSVTYTRPPHPNREELREEVTHVLDQTAYTPVLLLGMACHLSVKLRHDEFCKLVDTQKTLVDPCPCVQWSLEQCARHFAVGSLYFDRIKWFPRYREGIREQVRNPSIIGLVLRHMVERVHDSKETVNAMVRSMGYRTSVDLLLPPPRLFIVRLGRGDPHDVIFRAMDKAKTYTIKIFLYYYARRYDLMGGRKQREGVIQMLTVHEFFPKDVLKIIRYFMY